MRVITNKMLMDLGYYPRVLMPGVGQPKKNDEDKKICGYILFKENELTLSEQKGLEKLGFVRDMTWKKSMRFELRAGYQLVVNKIPEPKDPWD